MLEDLFVEYPFLSKHAFVIQFHVKDIPAVTQLRVFLPKCYCKLTNSTWGLFSPVKYCDICPLFEWSVAFFFPQLKHCLTLNLPPGLIWLFTLNNGNKSEGKCFSHGAGTMFFWYENSFPLFLKQSFDFLGFPFMTFRRKGNCCWIWDAWDFCFILYFSNIWTLLQDGTN